MSRTPFQLRLVCAAGAVMFLAALAHAAAPAAAGPVAVEFVRPETFTDVGDRLVTHATMRAAILETLRGEIVEQASQRLAPGERLVVRVLDVDMAGDFEPGRTASMIDGPRIVRWSTRPRIELDFELVAANGTVLKGGRRTLTDAMFLTRTAPVVSGDPLRHEKALLSAWIGRELQR